MAGIMIMQMRLGSGSYSFCARWTLIVPAPMHFRRYYWLYRAIDSIVTPPVINNPVNTTKFIFSGKDFVMLDEKEITHSVNAIFWPIVLCLPEFSVHSIRHIQAQTLYYLPGLDNRYAHHSNSRRLS